MTDIMGLTASLDIGSEKMAMAVAGVDNRGDCHLTGIKMIASQGVKEGVITDKAKVKSYVQYLLRELVRDKQVDVLNVSLSGKALRMGEQRVSVSLQRKTVKEADLVRAENKCIELVSAKGKRWWTSFLWFIRWIGASIRLIPWGWQARHWRCVTGFILRIRTI